MSGTLADTTAVDSTGFAGLMVQLMQMHVLGYGRREQVKRRRHARLLSKEANFSPSLRNGARNLPC